MNNLFAAAREALVADDVQQKLERVRDLQSAWQAGRLAVVPVALDDVIEAGRPSRPELVDPRDVPRRRMGSPEGHAAMIHAIGHIEFNAINLALDAVFRYRDMPPAFYGDWIQVAAEEVYHFDLISRRLSALGYAYGDFPAHSGLWDLAKKTAHDLLLRMALVPRMMEARGLDVTPGIMQRFKRMGDEETVAVLEIIHWEEIGHVQAGDRWFRHVCRQRGVEPESTYLAILQEHFPEGIRCPLHVPARLAAGFSEGELDRLEQLCTR